MEPKVEGPTSEIVSCRAQYGSMVTGAVTDRLPEHSAAEAETHRQAASLAPGYGQDLGYRTR
jgi:hypothetical protein